ncbi:MAG: twin-arginine translocase TatA/TatE family subunit [Elusimicrobia bacterium]|nr:twin-arginine translocase TatA/TatE family subunit [Elusimicrobiota bacterium]MBD3412516.1 twin-arginine translocase TatA/TatE family subunit [Elusimicrobiota bacterium]
MLPNLGWGELILIFFILLLVFGARKLPEIGRSIGHAIQSFKKGMKDTQDESDTEDKK